MRIVGVVTVARSDYGHYRPLLRELDAREDVELVLFAGGMHLVERFGSTIAEVEADGYTIAERVDFLLPGDSPQAVAESLGRGVAGFSAAFACTRPDILVVLGDRFEMLGPVVAALPLGLPVAHLHGGELTEGAFDDAIRHAITKLAHLHFVAAEPYARRVRQLGEEDWRVTVVGAPGLDVLRTLRPLVDDELRARFGLVLDESFLLVTFHPETLELDRTEAHAREVLAAVEDSGLRAVLTYPNADPGHAAIVELLESRAAGNPRWTLVRSLGNDAWFTLLRRAAALVGNSSSGLVEAPSFRLPVVNVGERQRGRLRAANVLDVEPARAAVAAAIAQAVSPAFRAGLDGLVNPYGDGGASPRIADVLASVPLDERLLVKRFVDR